MSRRARWLRAPGALVAALVLANLAFGQREAETLSASFRKAAEKVLPAVVAVRPIGLVERPVAPSLFGRPLLPVWPGVLPGRVLESEPLPGGSGVVVEAARGLILTSAQAVAGAARIVVVFEDGRELEARRVIRDPRNELAVLVVDPASLRVKEAVWGSSEALRLGDWVLALGRGNDRAALAAAGIVSGRSAAAGHPLRSSAVLGAAGSGGPVIDLEGRIVGIGQVPIDPRGWPEALAPAVPAERARACLAETAAGGPARRGYLGVMLAPASNGVGLSNEAASLAITSVTVGSPAARRAEGGRPDRGSRWPGDQQPGTVLGDRRRSTDRSEIPADHREGRETPGSGCRDQRAAPAGRPARQPARWTAPAEDIAAGGSRIGRAGAPLRKSGRPGVAARRSTSRARVRAGAGPRPAGSDPAGREEPGQAGGADRPPGAESAVNPALPGAESATVRKPELATPERPEAAIHP